MLRKTLNKNVICVNKIIESLNDATLFSIKPPAFFSKKDEPKNEDFMRIMHLLECEKEYRRNIRDASVHNFKRK